MSSRSRHSRSSKHNVARLEPEITRRHRRLRRSFSSPRTLPGPGTGTRSALQGGRGGMDPAEQKRLNYNNMSCLATHILHAKQ